MKFVMLLGKKYKVIAGSFIFALFFCKQYKNELIFFFKTNVKTNSTDKKINIHLPFNNSNLLPSCVVATTHNDTQKNNLDNCVISMSLFGTEPRYTKGAVQNAQLLSRIFPGWSLRIYIPLNTNTTTKINVPLPILKLLIDMNVRIHTVDTDHYNINPRMWRFFIGIDKSVSRFIIRDTDSRLLQRDYAEVKQWINSGKGFHCMRDHPSHGGFPIMAGMWGAIGYNFRKVIGNSSLLKRLSLYSSAAYLSDQQFLRKEIWPKVQNDIYCSDSFYCKKFPFSYPFITARSKNNEFVGEVYDQLGHGRKSDRRKLLNALKHPSSCAIVANVHNTNIGHNFYMNKSIQTNNS